MLVVSRKVEEWIRVADNIEIGVLSIKGNQVRIGVRAPAEIPVLRGELCDPPIVPAAPKPKTGNRRKRRAA